MHVGNICNGINTHLPNPDSSSQTNLHTSHKHTVVIGREGGFTLGSLVKRLGHFTNVISCCYLLQKLKIFQFAKRLNYSAKRLKSSDRLVTLGVETIKLP